MQLSYVWFNMHSKIKIAADANTFSLTGAEVWSPTCMNDCDLWPLFDNHRALPLVLITTAQTLCKCLYAKSVFVSFRAFVLACFHLCLNRWWLWGARVLECMCVYVCEWQRVLNMCWRSQRNSRALIRTSPIWQLVNSVFRIGVLYSYTKECKLVPVPSGHWERIHMAHTLTYS